MSASLNALSERWVKFLPRDAKSSSFKFGLAMNGGVLACKLKIAFHYYIESFRQTWAGDSLDEVIRAFIDGADGTPPHPDSVFDPASLKVEKLAPGYARPQAVALLEEILRTAFPPTKTAPAPKPGKATPTRSKASAARTPKARKPARARTTSRKRAR